jgi:hypothetical protein
MLMISRDAHNPKSESSSDASREQKLGSPKPMPGSLRPYHYLKVAEQDRDNPHLVRELVRCGSPPVAAPRT